MQKKKGISLIVLVITIIVMIVLAGAIILSLNNSGIIEKANEAVKSTDEATVKELVQMAWAEAYASGVRTVEDIEVDGNKKLGFKGRIEEVLEKNDLNPDDYGMKVTTSGVTVKKGWLQDGFKLIKGNNVLEIGDVVNYNSGVSTYKDGWKVLGLDDNENLLIVSTGYVSKNFRLGYQSAMNDDEKIEECIRDLETGVKQLNDECLPYGGGKGAIGARSITIDDVNKITGFVSSTYSKGQIYQYGNVVTYKYNGTTKPAYSSANKSGTLSNEHGSGFYYYNGEKVVHINDLTTGTSGDVFATITSNSVYYKGADLTAITKTNNPKIYTMIFGEYDEKNSRDSASYWLASPYSTVYAHTIYNGLQGVRYGAIIDFGILNSNGTNATNVSGVRAVITLSSDIVFTGLSEAGWSY